MHMRTPSSSAHGLTLVELLVAMTLGLLITLAAVAALLVGQQGFRSIDAASQVRDNTRFASDIMRRVILQAGYLSPQLALLHKSISGRASPNPAVAMPRPPSEDGPVL